MRVKSVFYQKLLDDNKVQCVLCSKKCIIPENGYGFCKTQLNIKGTLYIENYAELPSYNMIQLKKNLCITFSLGLNLSQLVTFHVICHV